MNKGGYGFQGLFESFGNNQGPVKGWLAVYG